MKTILITGGARGIGAHMVRYFTKQGWQVAFCYRASQQKAEELQNETGALAIKCDVRDEAQVKDFIAQALKKFHHVDALVVNAGVAWAGLTEDMSTADYAAVCDTNLRGAFLCVREALPHLRDSKGAIVLVSSMWGVVGASCETMYSATKAAVQMMARSLAKEVGPSGVRVNCVAPGVIQTDMMKNFDEETLHSLAEDTPLMRLGTPVDVASTVAFLVSDEASFITGQVIAPNGGMVI